MAIGYETPDLNYVPEPTKPTLGAFKLPSLSNFDRPQKPKAKRTDNVVLDQGWVDKLNEMFGWNK